MAVTNARKHSSLATVAGLAVAFVLIAARRDGVGDGMRLALKSAETDPGIVLVPLLGRAS